jgi:hypothetical protein
VSLLVREYVSAEQLAALTPWSIDAIERMVRRGELTIGEHYFQPKGPRTQRVFKWSAIVAWIEKGRARDECQGPDPAAPGLSTDDARAGGPEVLDAGQIAARAAELLRVHAV